MARLLLVYEAGCPNCGGVIDEERLIYGLPCVSCLSIDGEGVEYLRRLGYRDRILAVARLLEEAGRLRGWEWLAREEEELDIFERFFERATGSRPWSAQRQWARRLIRGESFAIVAPTGVGKTTLLSVYALYAASLGNRIYYLLPTSNLARQVAEKLRLLASNASVRKRIVEYHGMLGRRAKGEALEAIETRDYDILVTTTAFLSRRWELLRDTRFNVILVDDVDAILRNSVNVDRILVLLGASPEEVKAAQRLVKLQLRVKANPALYPRLRDEIERLSRIVMQARERLGQLIVASATGRARGIKKLVLSKMLGLSVGSITGYARNIAEYKLVDQDPARRAVEIVSRLGPGGLVFVAKPLGAEAARRIASMLNEAGVKAAVALAGRKVVERFERGDVDVLVGVAAYYGVMVRGLDLPYRVAYAVFVEPPFSRVELEKALRSPRRILALAKALGLDYKRYARLLARLTPDEVELVRMALSGRLEAGGKLAEVVEEAERLAEEIRESVSRLQAPLRTSSGILVPEPPSLQTPDIYTYIQASGRTSRLIKGYMSRGVVIIISSNPVLLELFEERLRRLLPSASLRAYDEEEVLEELEGAWRSRRYPGAPPSIKVDIETSLVVVESPTKAKMIAGFWGRPARKNYNGVTVYETMVYNPKTGKTHLMMVTAVKGHVYDLTEEPVGEHGVILEGDAVKPVYAPIVKCRSCGAQHAGLFERCPDCGSEELEDKRSVVETLRRLAPLVDRVYIATDPDYEGEKIAWDVYALLSPYARRIDRIEFHEVTRNAFLEALARPRSVDRRLVEAQVVRRVEDRWIGFMLSQHLWRVFNARWLGAGRVQTPALGFLVERLEEWKRGRCYAVILEMPWGRVKLCYSNVRDAREALREALEEGVEVEVVERREEYLPPLPPYTTETMIYDASRILGYTSEKTMKLAQELFENGIITYHRTDSTRVSDAGLGVARSYLSRRGLPYVPRRWGEGGAHEAIRPTMPLDPDELRDAIAEGEVRIVSRLRESHYRLYKLIFQRFMASQMPPARIEKATVRLVLHGQVYTDVLVTKVYEPGFTLLYPYVLRLAEGLDSGRLRPQNAKIVRTSRTQLYTHGELVAEMRKSGIGRPSTYAKIIDALKRHGYVVESRYRKYLVPTKTGVKVYNYLATRFASLVSLERTRLVEKLMELVERGEENAADLLYSLHQEVVDAVRRVEHVGEAGREDEARSSAAPGSL